MAIVEWTDREQSSSSPTLPSSFPSSTHGLYKVCITDHVTTCDSQDPCVWIAIQWIVFSSIHRLLPAHRQAIGLFKVTIKRENLIYSTICFHLSFSSRRFVNSLHILVFISWLILWVNLAMMAESFWPAENFLSFATDARWAACHRQSYRISDLKSQWSADRILLRRCCLSTSPFCNESNE